MIKLNPFIFAAILMFTTPFSFAAEVVNINTADAAALSTNLKGIGPKKAKAIVQYRKKHGKFKSADDLLNVPGIGPKTLNENKKWIALSGKKPLKK